MRQTCSPEEANKIVLSGSSNARSLRSLGVTSMAAGQVVVGLCRGIASPID